MLDRGLIATRRVLVAGVTLLGSWVAIPTTALASAPDKTVFVDVNVIPMDSERVLERHTVVVEGEAITKLGPTTDVKVPPGATVIQGKGRYLMPGLADMHMHLKGEVDALEGPGQLVTYLAQGVTTVRNMGGMPEHLEWRDAVREGTLPGPTVYTAGPTIVGFPEWLGYLRWVLMAVVVGALSVAIGLGWLLARVVIGRRRPELFARARRFLWPSLALGALSGVLLVWLKVVPIHVATSLSYPWAHVVESRGEAIELLHEQKAAGYDFLKIYDYLDAETYRATLAEAKQLGIYATGHVSESLSVVEATQAGLGDIAHIDEFVDSYQRGQNSAHGQFQGGSFDVEAMRRDIPQLKATGAMVVSNLVADEVSYQLLEDVDGQLARDEYALVPASAIHHWKTAGRAVNWRGQETWRHHTMQPFLIEVVKELHRAGVPLLVGTDVSIEGLLPVHLHRDLEILVEAGLSPYDALCAGTKNAGLAIGRFKSGEQFGTIAPGRRADLLLVDNNPLSNVSHTRKPRGVMARGRWYSRQELDRLVAEYAQSR